MIAHSYPNWHRLATVDASCQLAYRFFHTENEDGIGLDVGLTGDADLFATVYTATKEGDILAGTTRGQNVRVPSYVNISRASTGDRAAAHHHPIPDHQEVMEEILNIAGVAAENLVVQGERDVSEWVKATLNGYQEAILRRYDDYTQGVRSLASAIEYNRHEDIDSLLDIFPEKCMTARLFFQDVRFPQETLIAHSYIAFSKSKVPHVIMARQNQATLGLNLYAAVGFGPMLAEHYLYETITSRSVLAHSLFMPPTLPRMHLLLRYGRQRDDRSPTPRGGVHYLYFWEVDDFNPTLLHFSLLSPPPRADWYSPASETPAVSFVFRPFPLPVYRAYRQGGDFAGMITEEDVRNLL